MRSTTSPSPGPTLYAASWSARSSMRMSLLPPKVGGMAEGGPSRKRADALGAKLEVEIVRHGEAWAGPVTDALLKRAAQAVMHVAPSLSAGAYQVTLVLTDDEEMRTLNRTWRGKDAS